MTTYLIIFFGTMALSLWASWRVKRNFALYSKMRASSGLTGAEVAERILRVNGIRDVTISACSGTLTDHYDPRNKQLVLCDENFYGNSVAAVGVAAHETGHAIQHAKAYGPLHWRMAAVGITTSAGMLIPIIGLAGMFFSPRLALIGLTLCFGIMMLFQLVTLPVEFDATARAKQAVSDLNLVHPGDERDGMNKVLDAAAWTYVAAFIGALAQFLYYAMQLMGGNRRE